ncbi:hypothetical protein [Catalinimonas niigatensis]|nr:hypothetical protein [Catalinimonas niigatensis]WPP52593.1 hypothetical protein PZB72_09390 [Catalinimonas niigatensis]
MDITMMANQYQQGWQKAQESYENYLQEHKRLYKDASSMRIKDKRQGKR